MEAQTPAMIDRIRTVYDEMTAKYRGSDGLLELPTTALLAAAVKQ